MRSKVAVVVSLVFVLAIGAAALAVNTRILETSPQPDIGHANEVLAPSSAPAVEPPAVTPPALPPTVSSPRIDDEGSRDDHDESEGPEHDSDD